MADHGPDGYGPPPSGKAAEAVAPFLSDNDQSHSTPEQRAEIEANIKERRAPWQK